MTGQADQRTKNMVHYPSGVATNPQDLSTYIDTLRADVDTLAAVTTHVTADSAFGTDNRLLRSDSTLRKAQASAVTVDDSGNASGIVNQTMTGYLDVAEIAAPSSPAADTARVYAADSSGTTKLYYKRSDGTAVEVAAVSALGMVLLTSGSVSAATLDIPLGAYTAYRGIVVELYQCIPATDGSILQCLFSTDNGSSFIGSGYNYIGFSTADDGNGYGQFSGSAAIINLTSATAGHKVGNGANEGYNGTIKILGWQATAIWPRITHQGYYISNAATPEGIMTTGGGSNETAQDMTALRFQFDSGNIVANYALYGLA